MSPAVKGREGVGGNANVAASFIQRIILNAIDCLCSVCCIVPSKGTPVDIFDQDSIRDSGDPRDLLGEVLQLSSVCYGDRKGISALICLCDRGKQAVLRIGSRKYCSVLRLQRAVHVLTVDQSTVTVGIQLSKVLPAFRDAVQDDGPNFLLGCREIHGADNISGFSARLTMDDDLTGQCTRRIVSPV